MGKLLRFACLLAIAAFTTCASIAAHLATPRAADPRPASEKAALPTDPLGRDTPYGTVVGFTRAINSQETERAAQYLEGAQAGQRKEELAHMLNTVLDRAAAVQLDKLSRQPEGHLGDGLAPDLEQIAAVPLEEQEDLGIILRRVQHGFAVLAYPASYGSSGVKSFVVSHEGVVYEGDFGAKTAELAPKVKLFNPGPGWNRADVQ
jgi:hypothetical protein